MSQAKAYYPNQSIPEQTVDVYMREWISTSSKYGIERFRHALGNRLRQSDFFPLPQHIADECKNLKLMSEELPGTRMNVYRCPACPSGCAGERMPAACVECGSPMRRAANGCETDVEMARYHAEIKDYPERFVRVGDIFREAMANVAARKLAKA